MLGEPGEAVDPRLHELLVVEPFGDDHVEQRVEERHVGAGAELQEPGGVAGERIGARIGHHQLHAALRRLLEEGGRHRVVLGRIGADHEDQVTVQGLGEGGRDRTAADPLHERRHRGGVAQPRAVVDGVVAEDRAHELLDQIGLLVGALGGAEGGERPAALPFEDALQARRREIQRLLPARLAEVRPRVLVIHIVVGTLGDALPAHQWPGEPVRMVDVVEAEAALDAQPAQIGRTRCAGDVADAPVLHVVDELAAHAAVGAYGAHRGILAAVGPAALVDDGGGQQRAGGTGLHALAAGHAGRFAHGIDHVEDDAAAVAAERHADHVVDLHLAAGAHAEIAVDAGIELHHHGRMRAIRRRRVVTGGEAARGDADRPRLLPEAGYGVVGRLPLGLVGQQQLEDQLARPPRPLARRAHHHARLGPADAGGGERALALDLHHAGAAVAVGPVARLGQPAQVGDLDALAAGHLPDGLARPRLHLAAVEHEADGLAHDAPPSRPSSPAKCRNSDSTGLPAA
ncbi:hypothetical protein HRbin39_01611 [bacterium HR39]|nr:hypothetical protein HRbin39_01611 [bacterium HR39]